MNPTPSSKSSLATTTQDYGESYYHNYEGPPYEESEPHWAEFFGAVAAHLVKHLAPKTALDAGCAKGFLVDAFVREGVDAHGIDISDFAIENAVTTVRDRVGVHDLTEPLDGHWDLICCIEVLEHMDPVDAQRALDNITAATDLVLFSSTPRHYDDPTHVNVHSPADWAEWYAVRGFFRRTDVDVSGISRWASVFERRQLAAPAVVHLYEVELAPLREELEDKRGALLSAQRELDKLQSDEGPKLDTSVERVLTLTDQVLGLQAELGQVRHAHERFTHEAHAQIETERQLRESAQEELHQVKRTLERSLEESEDAWTGRIDAELEEKETLRREMNNAVALLNSRLQTERELRQSLNRRLEEETTRAEETTHQLAAALATQQAAVEPVTTTAASPSERAARLLRRAARKAASIAR